MPSKVTGENKKLINLKGTLRRTLKFNSTLNKIIPAFRWFEMISGALNPNLLSEGILSGCYDIIKWARNVPSYDNQSGVRMVSLQSCELLWLFWYDWDDGNWFVTAGCHPTHFSYHIWITKQSVREEEIKYKNKRCHSLGDTTEILVACLLWRISVSLYSEKVFFNLNIR